MFMFVDFSIKIIIILKANRMHAKFSKIGWNVDKTTVFAQIDAFIQRCKDLLEVSHSVENNDQLRI